MRQEAARDLRADPLVALLSHPPLGEAGEESERMAHVRRQAREAFLSTGLPTRRDENWRYTDLGLIRRNAFRLTSQTDVSRPVDRLPKLLGPGRSAPRLVFVNGGLRPDLSSFNLLRDGVSVVPLAHEMGAAAGAERTDQVFRLPVGRFDNPLVALNTAMVADGVSIAVGEGVDQDVWLELVFVGGATEALAYALRHVVQVAKATRLGIVEHHVAFPGGATFANSVMQIKLEQGATLRHYRLIDGGPSLPIL